MIQNWFLKALAGLLALVCTAAYWIVRAALSPPADLPPPPEPTVEESAVAEEAVEDLTATLRDAPQPKEPRRQAFTKTLTEKQINDYLSSHREAAKSDLPVERVYVELLPGSLKVFGVLLYENRKLYLQVTGRLSVPDGRTPEFVPTEISTGRVPVVGPLRERICEDIERRLPPLKLPDNVYVRSLEITDDSVIIYGDRYGK